MTVLIDAKPYGCAFMHAQRAASMKTDDAARIFNVTKSDWGRICRGTVPIPQDLLVRVLDAGGVLCCFDIAIRPAFVSCANDAHKKRRWAFFV